jgi:mRNA interferase RelE/StbE
MAYTLVYHPDVRKKDIPALNRNISERISRAIETRLSTDPQHYGEPLRRTLKGYWKLRVGDYRIVFKVVKNEVWIFAIINRREVYERIAMRLTRQGPF